MSICLRLFFFVQEFAAKPEKLFSEHTANSKLRASEHSVRGQADAKSGGHHLCAKSDTASKVDGDFCRADLSNSSNSLNQLVTTRDEKLCKQDAADIVIRQLTPYYKGNRFSSKVSVISDKLLVFSIIVIETEL